MADQKPSNRERVKEIVSSIEQNIQDLFQSERYFDYLRTMSRFHSYSVNNTILIHMQRPHASMPAAGFNKWKQFGRHVKKGEKGLTIIAPTPLKKKIEEMRLDPDTKAPVLDGDGNIIMDEKTVEIPLFKPVKVFTADQTEGKALPSLATDLTGDVQQYEAFMEALRRTSPMPISFAPLAPDTDGVCSFTKQAISIREGMSQVQTVCATVHEIGHAVLHDREKDRLSAAAGNTDKEPPKAKDKNTMEVEAESVSFAVCQYYGIDTSANSMGYIAGWSRDKSLPELKASLETITKTVSGLISTIDRHFAEICKERGIDLAAQPEQAGPDTLGQFAADLYDYMDQLHQTGILERPFTLDPREQSIADLVTEMQTGYFDGVRGPLTYLVEHNSLMTAKAMLERLEGLIQALPDTPEKFVYDLCGYLAELQEARLIPLPNNAELREKENMAEALLPSMLNGSFNGFRSILNDAAQHTERPETAVLRDRLEKLSDQWDAALVYKIEPIFGAGSTVDRSAVQTYRKQNDQLTPYKLVFTGTAAECQRVVAGLEAGTFTLRDMRQPDFEPPSSPGQSAPAVPAPPEQADTILPETSLDEYPMPDSSMTLDDLAELGYGETDLLPLSRDRGAELVDRDMTVYMVRTGEAPEMVFDREDLMEQPEGVMFAVPREEWEDSPDFRQAVADRMDRQEDRERAFLNHGGDCFAIYQVKLDGDDSLRDIRYESLDWLNSIGRKVERGNYDLAYTAPLSEVNSADEALERLWYVFNNDHPADYQRPSMSVSDIIAIRLDGVLTCHYCDSYGFKQLPDFIQPENYLKNAEMSLEDDLGMIDGIINNGPKEPTVAELEAQVKAGQRISLMDLAGAVHREQEMKKKSVVSQLKGKPPQKRQRAKRQKSSEKGR